MPTDQAGCDLACEWGLEAVTLLAPISDVVVIVDVLSFSTTVEVGVGRGAVLLPFRWRDETAASFAAEQDAQLASPRGTPGAYSLSPAGMLEVPAGARIVLPSPNGSTLSTATGDTPTLTGCLRNATAVAAAAAAIGPRIAVIPGGERWAAGPGLRPAIEDLLGAGAILGALSGLPSPEAQLAIETFRAVAAQVDQLVWDCRSGEELRERGLERDVRLAGELNVSQTVPRLLSGVYRSV